MPGPILAIPPNILALLSESKAIAEDTKQLLDGRSPSELDADQFEQFWDMLQRVEKIGDEIAWKLRAVNRTVVRRVERRLKLGRTVPTFRSKETRSCAFGT